MKTPISRYLTRGLAVAILASSLVASSHAASCVFNFGIGTSIIVQPPSAGKSVTVHPFGKMPDGRKVELYTLTNSKGVRVSIATYGATVVHMVTPDRNGKLADISLGFDTIKPYVANRTFFGSTIGRYGNRVAKGKFCLDGKVYSLPIFDAPGCPNSLHGGVKGLDTRLWTAKIKKESEPTVCFTYHSPDGEQGYPGNMDVSVEYSLNDSNELEMEYTATTDKKTIVNLTNHTFFNLAGEGNGTILNHELMIPASRFTPVDQYLIPTGELKKVKGTVMDFRTPMPIGSRMKELGNKPLGYDHNYVVNRSILPGLDLNARVFEPKSGRVLEVYSDQPGVQFYCGSFLDGTLAGKGGKKYPQYGAFCLEPQHYPDSPNKPQFPSTVLNPGQKYHAKIVFRFRTK